MKVRGVGPPQRDVCLRTNTARDGVAYAARVRSRRVMAGVRAWAAD